MGKCDDSDKNSICVEEDERARTPVITGPIIELRGREVVFAICVFFLTAIVVGLIVVLASNKVNRGVLPLLKFRNLGNAVSYFKSMFFFLFFVHCTSNTTILAVNCRSSSMDALNWYRLRVFRPINEKFRCGFLFIEISKFLDK